MLYIDEDGQLAGEIANEIAASYIKWMTYRSDKLLGEQLDRLQSVKGEQQELVDGLSAEVLSRLKLGGRLDPKFLAAKDQYEIERRVLAEMKQRIVISTTNQSVRAAYGLRKPRAVVSPALTLDPIAEEPFAIGGTANHDRRDLSPRIGKWLTPVLFTATGLSEDGRSPGVGFRFVMADE
jgi:hypothetical protein